MDQAVEEQYVQSVKITPDVDKNCVRFEYVVPNYKPLDNLSLKTRVTFKGQLIREVTMSVDRASVSMEMNLVSDRIGEWKTVHTWSPGNPNLYEVEFTLLKNSVETGSCNILFRHA